MIFLLFEQNEKGSPGSYRVTGSPLFSSLEKMTLLKAVGAHLSLASRFVSVYLEYKHWGGNLAHLKMPRCT